jgi:hypothetical protein
MEIHYVKFKTSAFATRDVQILGKPAVPVDEEDWRCDVDFKPQWRLVMIAPREPKDMASESNACGWRTISGPHFYEWIPRRLEAFPERGGRALSGWGLI